MEKKPDLYFVAIWEPVFRISSTRAPASVFLVTTLLFITDRERVFFAMVDLDHSLANDRLLSALLYLVFAAFSPPPIPLRMFN